jgi:cation transport ATPase
VFDLDQAIANWREQMLAAGIKTPVPLEELESHLREEIERKVKAGANQQEAFTSAVQKLGSAQVVRAEFEKADETHEARKWKLTNAFLMVFTIVLPLFMSVIVINRASVIDMTATQELSSLAAMAVFFSLAWAGRLSQGIFPVIANRRIRDAISALGSLLLAVWWIVFMRLIVPRHDFVMSQFLVAFVWAFFLPAGMWVGWLWGMEAAARRKFVPVGV